MRLLLQRWRFISSEKFISKSSATVATKFSELLKEQQPKEDVKIQGWVQHVQRHGKMLFLKVNDGASPHQIQAVVPKKLTRTINFGSAIELRGQWIASIGPQQNMEFLAKECHIFGQNEHPGLQGDNDNLRQTPHLRAKTLEYAAILRMRSQLTHLTHQFFNDRFFTHVDTPMFSQNDCEGAGETFNVSCQHKDFFDDSQAYLPVSGQLHLEAICSSLPRVYTLSPAFRADTGVSRQHLAEFRMLEAELAFVDSLDVLCDFVEEFLRFILERTNQELADDFQASAPLCQRESENFSTQFLSKCLENRLDKPLPRITFLDALQILGRSPDEKDPPLRPLNRKEDMELVEKFRGPLFVTHFPRQQKPFYMRHTDDGKFAECFDLLVPFAGELAGGSVREWDPTLLASRLPGGADAISNKLDWYLELRRWGYPRTAGFGIGMDRLMQSLFGVVNVKDTIPFPRCYRQAIKC